MADSVFPLSAIGAAEGDPVSLLSRALALHDGNGTGGMKLKPAALDMVDKLLFFLECETVSRITKLFLNVSDLELRRPRMSGPFPAAASL
jgi:hypothetical protein